MRWSKVRVLGFSGFIVSSLERIMNTNDERICRDKAIEMLDRMIEHHSLRYKSRFSVSDHLAAVETLKAMRDHLDRCYEIRSYD